MANSAEEANPLLPSHPDEAGSDAGEKNAEAGADLPAEKQSQSPPETWTAEGMPVVNGRAARSPWGSSIFACLGRHDDFCSSDLEVCLLGSVAPCVLYGSNIERLSATPQTFADHCLRYSGLYLIGNSLFGWNCLAPWFSHPSRTAIRRMFNLEGTCEGLARSCGCCGSIVEDDIHLEQCELTCDFVTHMFCHACALCQEAREVRRRISHPGHMAQPPVMVVIPPREQTMGRADAAA